MIKRTHCVAVITWLLKSALEFNDSVPRDPSNYYYSCSLKGDYFLPNSSVSSGSISHCSKEGWGSVVASLSCHIPLFKSTTHISDQSVAYSGSWVNFRQKKRVIRREMERWEPEVVLDSTYFRSLAVLFATFYCLQGSLLHQTCNTSISWSS